MNERLQKIRLNFFLLYDVAGEARPKSDLKAVCVVHDLCEKRRHTFSSFIKICLAEVRHN